jgi:hypothetical protein
MASPKARGPKTSRGISNSARWALALAGGLAAIVMAGVIVIKVTNKDGTTTTIEVPDTVKHVELSQDGKPIGRIALNPKLPDKPNLEPPPKEPSPGAVDEAAQRKAVEWILAKGGEVAVRIAGKERKLKPGDPLPSEQFTIEKIWIVGQKLTDQELLALTHFANLKELWLPSNYGLTGAIVPWIVQHPNLTALDISKSKIGDDDLEAIVSRLKKLSRISLVYTKVSPRGMRSLNDLPAIRGVDTSLHFDPEAVADWDWLRRAVWFTGKDSWLSDEAVGALQKSESLRDVGFVDFSRPPADIKKLAGIKGLKKLTLEYPKLWSAEHNQMLAEVPQLAEFQFGYGEIYGEWLKGLPDLPNLKIYRVVSSTISRISEADLATVANEHPKWQVIWNNQRILPEQGDGKTGSSGSPAGAAADLPKNVGNRASTK